MIDQVRDELYKAMDNDDNATILKLSRKLDKIIVEFILTNKSLMYVYQVIREFKVVSQHFSY